MKNSYKTASGGTHPILIEAARMMTSYAVATGAQICVYDHNYMPIRESSRELATEKNLCLFCKKYKNCIGAADAADTTNAKAAGELSYLTQNPCREVHINSAKEANRLGGSFTYMCDLGLMFWTSPICADEHFIGGILGTGLLGIDQDETCDRMQRLCNGAESGEELRKKITGFTRGSPKKIKSLAELTLICAESLSTGSGDHYAAMRRRARQQAKLSAKVEELKSKHSPDGEQPEYPLDKERRLLEALRRGDIHSSREILNEILAALLYSNPESPATAGSSQAAGKASSPEQFKHIQYRAIELAVLLSRIDIGSGLSPETILETNNRYFNSIQEARSIEDLTDALYRMVDDMAGQIFSFNGVRHASALKRAESYILKNLTRKIGLKEIAKASGFSAPYFSTIFKEEMGENLSNYLNRLRVEKACYMLVNTNQPLSKIAGECGFEDQSWFSKIFKAYTGTSPGKYRSLGGKPVSKNPETGLSEDYRSLMKNETKDSDS